MLAELTAIDAPTDPDDQDVDTPDPEELAFDAEPDSEGDDNDAKEATV